MYATIRFLVLGFVFVAAVAPADDSIAPTDDPTEPIVIDDLPKSLRGVKPRLWVPVFSPDGKKLATTSGWKTPPLLGGAGRGPIEPGELVLWDVAARRELLIVRQESTIRTAAFSPDGKRMILGDFAGNIRLIDTASGETIWNTQTHTDLVNSVAFADANTIVSGAFDGKIHFRDAETAKLKKEVEAPGDRIVTLAISPDRKSLAAVTWGGKVLVWDVASGESRHDIQGHPGIAEGLAFAPDSKTFVTTGWDNVVTFWDMETGNPTTPAEGHTFRVSNAVYSPDGKIVATGDDQGTVIFWDDAANQLANIKPYNSRCGLAFSPDSKLLAITGQNEKVTKLFNAQTRELVCTLERREKME